jgi:hypothetical protein
MKLTAIELIQNRESEPSPPEPERPPSKEWIVDRLVEILVGADAVLRQLKNEDAAPLLWIEQNLEKIYRDVDSLISRFAH